MSQLLLPSTETMQCVDCGKVFEPAGMVTGYATRPTDNLLGKTPGNICYDCCARDDEAVMRQTGNSRTLPLYLSKDSGGWFVANWPGSLRFKVLVYKDGKHNISETRKDIWFRDSQNDLWWGVQYGRWTQIVHCKRIKSHYTVPRQTYS